MNKLIDMLMELKKVCPLEENLRDSLGLSPGEVRCLSELSREKVLSSKELSRRVYLSASRGSRVIAHLVNRGFIELKRNGEDRRAVDLSVSVTGRECVDRIEEVKSLCEEKLFEKLSDREKEIVQQGVYILYKAFS